MNNPDDLQSILKHILTSVYCKFNYSYDSIQNNFIQYSLCQRGIDGDIEKLKIYLKSGKKFEYEYTDHHNFVVFISDDVIYQFKCYGEMDTQLLELLSRASHQFLA